MLMQIYHKFHETCTYHCWLGTYTHTQTQSKLAFLTCMDGREQQSCQEHDARLHLSQPAADQLCT